MADWKRLKRKQQYFDQLDSLQKESDDEVDAGRQASVRALDSARAWKKSRAAGTASSGCNGLSRSVSDTHVAALQQKLTNAFRPPLSTANAKGQTFSGHLSREIAIGASTSSAIPQTSGKRKRDVKIKLVPEAQQIFSGLHFYFFPPDDKNPARRMRITKALDFGASWRKEWSEDVTHVIVDKHIDYSLVLKYLKLKAIPSNVALVMENYPSECISYRTILDAKHPQFKMKGFSPPAVASKELSAVPTTVPTSHASSNTSLQLKPAGKNGGARRSETERSEETALSSQPPELCLGEQPAGSPSPGPSGAASTEEFEAVILQARQLQHVPFDDEDGPTSRPTSSEGPDTGQEEGSSTISDLLKQNKRKTQKVSDKFPCMQRHTRDDPGGPNAATIAILEQMSEYYAQIGDEWRTRAYRKACGTLRNHPTKVWTRSEALALPQIGDRLASKIEEIAFTNRLRRLDNARAEPSDQILQTFIQVYGAGFAQASKWVSMGYPTLDELSEQAVLTDNQRIGLEHYEDFNSRIPRAEVERHGEMVRKALQRIDPSFEVIVGGSYRRGAETSGDIDCIITRPRTGAAHLRTVVLDRLIPQLTASNFLVAALATTNRDDGSKWHGASCLADSTVWRRIDLLLVPSDEFGAALIYFTGNDIFNRSLRLLAGTKGMRLNQRGLYKDVMRGKGREKLSEGTLVEGRDEKRIFEVLGVPWRPPEDRIC